MKIYINSKKSRRFCIPVPLSIATLLLKPLLSEFTKRKLLSKIDHRNKVYLESFDFKGLFKSVNELKNYKGLKLVEVEDKEGNEVTIIV